MAERLGPPCQKTSHISTRKRVLRIAIWGRRCRAVRREEEEEKKEEEEEGL